MRVLYASAAVDLVAGTLLIATGDATVIGVILLVLLIPTGVGIYRQRHFAHLSGQ